CPQLTQGAIDRIRPHDEDLGHLLAEAAEAKGSCIRTHCSARAAIVDVRCRRDFAAVCGVVIAVRRAWRAVDSALANVADTTTGDAVHAIEAHLTGGTLHACRAAA